MAPKLATKKAAPKAAPKRAAAKKAAPKRKYIGLSHTYNGKKVYTCEGKLYVRTKTKDGKITFRNVKREAVVKHLADKHMKKFSKGAGAKKMTVNPDALYYA